MVRALLPAALLLLTAAAEPAPFEPSAERFADAAACKERLAVLADSARGGGYDAVEGPYELAQGDTRIHMVRAEAGGHRIDEHRCLGAELGARSWHHVMAPADEPFTVDSAARKAEWLKKDPGKQP